MSTLKAYEVSEPDEGHCAIRFATNNATARREGAAELDIDWEGVESCTRKPEFDQYAPGPVPPLVLIEHGWWFECGYHGCVGRVDADNEQEDEEGELRPHESPVAIGQSVFCCAEHAGRQLAWQRGHKAAEAALCELIYTRWPEANIVRIHVHVYGDRLEPPKYRDGRQVGGIPALADFKLPGLTYQVAYHFGEDDKLYVSPMDVDVFKSLYARKS